LLALGQYFIDIPPSQIDINYLGSAELFLNEVYKTAYTQAVDQKLQTMLIDVLARVADLYNRAKHSAERPLDWEFFAMIKYCGALLQTIATHLF
jgi:hypothetical protein